MAKKPNYSFEKRRKEMDRKAKKDARREEKLRRKQEGAAGDQRDSAPRREPGQHRLAGHVDQPQAAVGASGA